MANAEGWAKIITAATDLLKKDKQLWVTAFVTGLILYAPDRWNPVVAMTSPITEIVGVLFLFAVTGIIVNISVRLWTRTRGILIRWSLDRKRRHTLARLTPREKAHLLSFFLDESLEQAREAGGVMGLLWQKGVVVRTSTWQMNSMAPFALEKWARARLLKKPAYLNGYCRKTLASLRGRTAAEMNDVEAVERQVLRETRIKSGYLIESERAMDGSLFERLLGRLRSFVSSENYANRKPF